MKAVILAAGKGNRLFPHTKNLPKCLLKVKGHSILEYQIAALKQCNINDITIVLGHNADKIKEYLKTPVKFIENKDYATTNSSYSLWLTRDFIKDGFIYINSDLLFHPKMLQTLLDSKDPDAIIIDHNVNISDDMQKAHMQDNRILKMDKNLSQELASAEVVGPAKFSAEYANKIIQHITNLVDNNEKNQWAYEVFSNIAKDNRFIGIQNPGCFWKEVDTIMDLVNANKNIPPNFIDFKDYDIANPIKEEHKEHLDINNQTIPYMDNLLNSDFVKVLSNLPDKHETVRSILTKNKDLFHDKISQLNLKTSQASEIDNALQNKIENIEKELGKIYTNSIYSKEGLKSIIENVFSSCPEELKNGLYLKESTAISLLEKCPPKGLMNHMKCSSLPELLKKENPLDIISLSRHTEIISWQTKYKKFLSDLTAKDFENRKLRWILVDSDKYKALLSNSKQPQKPWGISHSKETGTMMCFTLDDKKLIKAPLLQCVIVFMHYFFETAYASLYYKHVSENNPDTLGKEVVNSFTDPADRLPLFYSNSYSENLFWKKAIELFNKTFLIEEAKYFSDSIGCGEYSNSEKPNDTIISLNIIDQLWDINFSGQSEIIKSFKYEDISFLYHFRQALWQKIFRDIMGLDEEKMDNIIIQNLGLGDVSFTKKVNSG
jgi:L-glutamine-phosphate cytidylyltransferase